MLHLILPAMLFMQAPVVPDFAGQLKAAGSRDILELPDGVTIVEEKTLPMDSLQSRPGGSPAPRGQPSGMGEGGQRGLRLIAVTLAPKEKLVLKLTTLDTNKMMLGFATPTQPGPMTDQVKYANRRPAELRARSLDIKNSLDEPFTVVVKISGYLDYAYKLEFQRSK